MPPRSAGPGPNDWRPFPLCYVGQTMVVTTRMYAPGVIAYQRLNTRVRGINLLQNWSQAKQQYYQRQEHRARVGSAVTLVAVGFMGVLLLAAGVVAASAAGVAVGGGAVAGGSTAPGGWLLENLAIARAWLSSRERVEGAGEASTAC